MVKVLVVEDDESVRYNIQDGLEFGIGDYSVLTAANGKEGIALWKAERPDIILADIEMPEMDGFEMVKYIRARDQEVPILFISGCKSSRDVIMGYNLGANNYIKKPFTADEIHAHMQAMLKMRDTLRRKSEKNLLHIGSFVLDASNAILKFATTKTISLTHREALVLNELCINKGEVVQRSLILEKFWEVKGGHDFYSSRSLDVLISRLRRKLKDDPAVRIQSIKGIGIMLVDPTTEKKAS